MLDLLRAARNAEIKKINKAEQDSILAAIDNAKRALAAFRQSPDYQQAKERTKEPNKMDLENHAREIAKRDNCSGLEALRRARTEHPDAFQDYNTPPLAKSSRDFDSLVAGWVLGRWA